MYLTTLTVRGYGLERTELRNLSDKIDDSGCRGPRDESMNVLASLGLSRLGTLDCMPRYCKWPVEPSATHLSSSSSPLVHATPIIPAALVAMPSRSL